MRAAPPELEKLAINVIRGLAIDAVQAANSGHPGMPLGAAPMAFALWTRHLRFNPRDPKWPNRDRFILSAGHGCMLLYALLHLTGYDLPLEEIKRFRQWGSKTPGHPENTLTPGVEMATGPLGQGFSSAVGMAIAERFLGATFNKLGYSIFEHFTYVICSDGDLMEGVTNEAASLAGHLQLGKLICLYDDNNISIDGSTDMAFTEDVGARFEALKWQVIRVADGMDVAQVDRAITQAKTETAKPSLIICPTVIGFGSPHKAGTAKVHGAALGEEEARLTKEALGLPTDKTFWVPEEVNDYFKQAVDDGKRLQAEWNATLESFRKSHRDEAARVDDALARRLPRDFPSAIPAFEEKLATRAASGKVLNAIASKIPTLIGGSADLAESNFTWLEGFEAFQAATPQGRNLCFGVREHAMCCAVNGMNLHGGVWGYGASFLIFTDYCRAALRLSALMHCPSIFVFTHDSIGLGEDGPTHQPVEHLMSLRAMPNMNVMRPADGNETAACWLLALERQDGPSLFALTRQALPAVTPAGAKDHPARRGAYVLAEAADRNPELVLIATGSEVHLALQARDLLEGEGIATRVVSMPSWFLFERQELEYRESVIPKGVPAVSVEAGATLGWERYAQAHVGLDRFGASAPGSVLMKEFGFTGENVAKVARDALGSRRPMAATKGRRS